MYIRIFFIAIFLTSCLDTFDQSPKEFVGNICIKNSLGESYLIFFEDLDKEGFFSFLIKDPILKMSGNDSLIYVETILDEKKKYTLIKHIKGKEIIYQKDIDSITFLKKTSGEEFPYFFYKRK